MSITKIPKTRQTRIKITYGDKHSSYTFGFNIATKKYFVKVTNKATSHVLENDKIDSCFDVREVIDDLLDKLGLQILNEKEKQIVSNDVIALDTCSASTYLMLSLQLKKEYGNDINVQHTLASNPDLQDQFMALVLEAMANQKKEREAEEKKKAQQSNHDKVIDMEQVKIKGKSIN